MKKTKSIKNILPPRKVFKYFCKKHGIVYLGVFGSYVKGVAEKNSDIDILVKFNEPKGLEFIPLQEKLANLLHKKVDLVTVGALHHLLKERILKEVITLYGKN